MRLTLLGVGGIFLGCYLVFFSVLRTGLAVDARALFSGAIGLLIFGLLLIFTVQLLGFQ